MNNIKPYKKYKASGIEWLGDIPEHWEVRKLKYNADILNGYAFKSDEYKDIGVPIVRIGDLKNENFVNITGKYVSGEFKEIAKSFIIQKFDILVALTGATIGKSSIYKHSEIALLNQRVGLIRNKPEFNQHFLQKIIASDAFLEHVKLECGGSAQENIGKPELSNFLIQTPPPPEQTAIANFLDYKTAKIDRFIRKKKQLIKLLNEQKAAIINDAVTKGLNPKTKMKPSGVEWLGDIPEHWEVRRIGVFGRFSKGGGISRAELLPEGKAAILYGDIYTKYNFEAKNIINRVSEETANNSIKLEIGDLLLTGSGETKEDIGKCIAFLSEEDTYAGGDVIIFKQNDNDSLFLSYALNSKGAVYQKILSAKGDIIVHIYGSKLKNIRIPIPPLSEQKLIVSHIQKETATLNTTIATIEKEIALVQEYRTALIAEAVTGKIDVREYCLNQDVEGLEDEQDFEEENADTIENRELNIAAEMEGKYGT